MTGFVTAAVIVATAGLLVWLAGKAVDGSVLAGATCTILLVFVLGVTINADIKENKEQPCHQYETRMMDNDHSTL